VIPHITRRLGGALLLVCLVAGVSLPARGQEEIYDLTQMPLAGHLSVGSETPGYLSSDLLWTDGSYVQAWGLELAAGQSVTVDLLSDEFDAYLIVTGPGLDEILSDDDGAGACDARITFAAPESAVYNVVVNTLTSEETGRYRIRVTDEPGPVTAGECNVQDVELVEWLMSLPTGGWELSLGQEVPGELSVFDEESWDGSYAQAWVLQMQAGQEATVDLLSDEFDAYLYVIGPGLDEPLTDDDGAGACDARVTFTAPQSGEYRVVVNSLWSEATGRFRLRVMDRPAPVTAPECDMIKNPDLDDEQLAWLMALPVSGRTLGVGDEVRGELTFSDSLSWDDTYIQAWDLQMRGGDEATVDLLSDDFDPYLMILGPGLPLRSDDDGAGACDARITFTAPETGTYRVLVKSILGESTGQFRLRATNQPGPTTAGECETLGDLEELMEEYEAELGEMPDWLLTLPAAGSLSVSDEVRGELTASDPLSAWDDTHVQVWELVLRAGEQATVDLRSTEFDAYLMLVGPGIDGVEINDDGAGACDARISFTASESGAFRVAVNTISAGATGSFRLRVTEKPGPTTPGECDVM
jgi:hypothetical protein